MREERESHTAIELMQQGWQVRREIRHAGRREDAEACYREAIVLFRDHEHIPKLDLANATRPLAILKDDAGEVDEARRLWEEARELYAAVNVQEGVVECSARLARLSR